MDNSWRDRVKQLGESVPEVSKKVQQHVVDSAPELTQRVRNQIMDTAPVVSHRMREAGRALTAPVPQQASPEQSQLVVNPSDNSIEPSRPVDSDSAAELVSEASQNAVLPGDHDPTGATAGEVDAGRPGSVHVAYVALVIAAAASAVLAGFGVYGLTEIRESVDNVIGLDPTGTAAFYANDYVDNAETTLMSSVVALGAIFALAYVLVAHAVRKGHGWPRPVGTCLAVLSAPAIFFGPVAVVIVVAGVVAVLTLWTPSARRFAVQAKIAKRPVRHG